MSTNTRQTRAHRPSPWLTLTAGTLALLLVAGLRASLAVPPGAANLPGNSALASRKVRLQGHTGGITALVFSPDGAILASASWDGTVRLWDATAGDSLGEPLTGHVGGVPALVFAPNGTTLLSASLDRTVWRWETLPGPNAGKATAQPIGQPFALPDPLDSLAFHPDGALLAYGACARWEKTWCVAGEIALWDLDTMRPIGPPLAGHAGIVESLAFSPDGNTLASGSWDTTVRLWEIATGQSIGPPLEAHTNVVTALAYSPDGATLASGSADRTVRLWATATGRPIGPPLTGHTDVVLSVAYGPDGALASGGYDGAVRLWDTSLALPGHAGSVTCLAFGPDGRVLASGGEDTTIVLWDLGEHTATTAYPSPR